MNKLTESEISLYIKEPNSGTGVRGISRQDLESIKLDEVQEIIFPDNYFTDGAIITDKDKNQLFKFDSFCPKAGSIYLKPSFAGRQILMGRVGRVLHFSNGRWFC